MAPEHPAFQICIPPSQSDLSEISGAFFFSLQKESMSHMANGLFLMPLFHIQMNNVSLQE